MKTLFLVTIFFINGQASFHPQVLPHPQVSMEQCEATVASLEATDFVLPTGVVLEGFYCMTQEETIERMEFLRSGNTDIEA